MSDNRSDNKGKSHEKQSQDKTFYQRFPILINILLMLLISIAIVLVIVFWLDRYTHHGQSVEVPDIVGMQLQDGTEQLSKMQLQYEVVDSVYSEDGAPGAIHDIVPMAGSKVKKNRIVFLTINAVSKPQLILPEVKDMSMRQAKATLEGIGFTTIAVKHVPGEYDNLTRCVEDAHGQILPAGARIDYDTPVTLVISSNNISFPDDSLYFQSLDPADGAVGGDSTTNKAPEKLSEEEKWW